MKNRKCILILPYFGKFNNYFSIFLKSCEKNPDFDWLIFTDCNEEYEYPFNVHVTCMTLKQVKELAEKKFGFEVCLNNAYKLCDYKPSYGFLFEEHIQDYNYWGHCDCDLIFGKMSDFLDPLFQEGYDKIFAAGHLTIYRNDYENNRRFMEKYHEHFMYREAFTTNNIYVLDEDIRKNNGYNVHRLFLSDGAKVFQNDFSMNPATQFARFRRAFYNSETNAYQLEDFKRVRYFWYSGQIVEYCYDGEEVRQRKFLYMHLQMRKMRIRNKALESDIFEILPDRFVGRKEIPTDKKTMRLFSVNWTYWRRVDEIYIRIKRTLNKLIFNLGR